MQGVVVKYKEKHAASSNSVEKEKLRENTLGQRAIQTGKSGVARLIAVFEETPSRGIPAPLKQQRNPTTEGTSSSAQNKCFNAVAYWEGLSDPSSTHFQDFWESNEECFIHFREEKTAELGDLGIKLNCISYIAHMQSRYQHNLSKQKVRMLWGNNESLEEDKKASLKEISELTKEDINALAKEAVLTLYPLPEFNNQRY